MKKIEKNMFFLCIVLFFFSILPVFSDSYTNGAEAFRTNKPQEAIIHLNKALEEGNANPSIYNYLGLAYYQTGQLEKSYEIFMKGTKVSGTNKKILYYNAGNTAFAMGNIKNAEDMYSLAIVADPNFPSAVLNRANARLRQDKLEDACEDYTQYLIMEPESPQNEEIRKLLMLLNQEMLVRKAEEERLAKEAERLRLEEERIARELEAQRIENERIAAEKAAAEAERRKKLLEEVAASLQGNESTNFSAGTEGVLEYEYENELD